MFRVCKYVISKRVNCKHRKRIKLSTGKEIKETDEGEGNIYLGVIKVEIKDIVEM